MLDLAQIHALAIFMLGAFFVVLVTAITYVVAFRARLVEPSPPAEAERIAQRLQGDLRTQRTAIEQLNAALDQHTTRLKASMEGTGGALAGLTGVLDAQSNSVGKLTGLLHEQAARLDGIDQRLVQQDTRLARLETDVIEAQVAQLEAISSQLDQWAADHARTSAAQDAQLQDHARLLAELDRELVAQAQAMQSLSSTVDDHTARLVQAADERQHQTSLLERVLDRVAQLMPGVSDALAPVPRTGQDRLTEIKGIGPVYAGRLYAAGITTFQQVAAMSEDVLENLVGSKRPDTASWIEQAQQLAAQQAEGEGATGP